MSRSFRKNKNFGFTCAKSEKRDKQICNRKLRHKVRQQIEDEDFDTPFPIQDEVMDRWLMDKDGRHYFPDATKKDMSK